MPLSEMVDKKLISCTPEDSVKSAAELMKVHDVGAILVIDSGGSPVGIITDRDIVIRCVCGTHADCSDLMVRNIMTRSPKTVRDSDGLLDVIRAMKSEGVRRIPIVNREGRAVALVSFSDVLELLATEVAALAATAASADKKLVNQVA